MEFVQCIRSGGPPLSGGHEGICVVLAMEAIEQSLSRRGAPVDVLTGPEVDEGDVLIDRHRHGITPIVGGQDGVSFALGDGAFATRYFAALNGRHPRYRGPGVAE